ncbi:hypothetical protein ANCCAN_29687, partial [Ancylostoma caninum]
CSSSDRRNGTTSHTIGTVFITFGIIGEIVYGLDMMVMVKKKYRAFSCYKIMIALGICDMSAIFVLCILGGYFWMIGATYCTSPNFMYITGVLANGNDSLLFFINCSNHVKVFRMIPTI